MEQQHINERGSHTTVIESAVPVLKMLRKNFKGIEVSPGKIEGGVGAKASSIKLKHINDEVYEMVVVHNSSRQEFKLFTKESYQVIISTFKKDKKLRDWNVNYTDMRGVNRSSSGVDLDAKYKV